MQKIILLLAFLCVSLSFSQSKSFKISGTLLSEEGKTPLESATIYLEKNQRQFFS